MAISSSAVLLAPPRIPDPVPSPSPCFFSVSVDPTRPLIQEKRASRSNGHALLASPFGHSGSRSDRGRGAGLLERPTLDQSQFDPIPQPQEGGDMGQLWNKVSFGNGDSYRVLLIDDARHNEKLVEKVVPQVVPSVTIADARKLFHESRQKGVAVIIVTVKEHAEFYAEMMVRWGLRSVIEPDSSVS